MFMLRQADNLLKLVKPDVIITTRGVERRERKMGKDDKVCQLKCTAEL